MKRILIADDSATARLFIRRCIEILSKYEMEFVEASNGEEALEIMKENPIDLALTDFNMPVMDGQTFLRHVMASPKLNSVPIIFITSMGNPIRNEELVAKGAVAVLGKPLTPAALAEVIEGIFEGAKQG
ncbi:MAG: response regulator [Planctomycetota bacterium]|jgi:two-component system chemotaxis response regulator CheY